MDFSLIFIKNKPPQTEGDFGKNKNCGKIKV
jgi:hypothetical protein